MPSLYVDRRGVALSLDGGAIAFHEAGKRIATVPLGPVERVYLKGDTRLSAGLLGQLGARGVGVVILSGRRNEPTMLLPRPHNDARIRVAQLDAARQPQRALTIAASLVAGKIAAQHDLLLEIRSRRPDLTYGMAASVEALGRMQHHTAQKADIAALRGLEGAAAASFFKAYVGVFPKAIGFTGRNRRPPRDPANAALSLSYTILHAEAVLAAFGHGFDPFVGFLHGLDFGRESFACDIVEPLRPLVERFVWRLFAEEILRARDFGNVKGGGCLLQKAGRTRFYAEIETILPEIRRRLEDMLSALRALLLAEPSTEAAVP